jgi:hypothetical protein
MGVVFGLALDVINLQKAVDGHDDLPLGTAR